MTFFPNTLAEWLALLVQVSVVIAAVAGFAWQTIRAPLVNQINGLGHRVQTVETGCTQHQANIEGLQRAKERAEFDRMAIHERMGKVEGMFTRMIEQQEKARDERHSDEQEVRERLARIEIKVDDLRREKGKP